MKRRVVNIVGLKWRIILHSIIIMLFSLISISSAQESDKELKLRLAQSFEESGEWEQAVKMYEDLYRLEPRNFIIVNGLQRSYTQIKEYEKAVNIIRKWTEYQPKDINLSVILGGIYYDSGNETTADSVWNNVLSANRLNIQVYRLVANEMMGHRLYERCIKVYRESRANVKNGSLFADELGSLYAALQQYTNAAEEYIRLLKTNPDQLYLVQSRLGAFTVKPEALGPVSQIIRRETESQTGNIALHRLHAWVLMEEKKYRPALEEYRIVDRMSNANGNELFNFAQRLSQEHLSEIAAEAFKEIIDGGKNPGLVPPAKLGYARALEESADLRDGSKTGPAYNDVIHIYESIVFSYPNSELAGQALFRIGIIKYEKLFDLGGALTAFGQARKLPGSSGILYESSLKIGEVQTAMNNLTESRAEYEKLRRVPQTVIQDQAAFRVAELDYFEAKFDSALSILKRFNTNYNTDLANDALQLQYFIQENISASPQVLADFAGADLLFRQRKYSESLAQFRNIVKQNPEALLVDDAMMKSGELCLRLLRPEEALTAFRFIADSIQLSILKDRSQFRIAEVYQNILNNKEEAMKAYETLLLRFPNSLYAEEARKRIRLLRGDAI